MLSRQSEGKTAVYLLKNLPMVACLGGKHGWLLNRKSRGFGGQQWQKQWFLVLVIRQL
jgi:hypothetical protein